MSTFAVIHAQGNQHKVSVGDNISVTKINGNPGDTITFDQVLMLAKDSDVTIGAPTVSGAVVKAEIVAQFKDEKIIVFKKHRRHNYRRKNGHRQLMTTLKVTEIKIA